MMGDMKSNERKLIDSTPVHFAALTLAFALLCVMFYAVFSLAG